MTLAWAECADTLYWSPSTKLCALRINSTCERSSTGNPHPKPNAHPLICLDNNPNKRHKRRFHPHLDEIYDDFLYSKESVFYCLPSLNPGKKKHKSSLSASKKLRARDRKQTEPESFCTKPQFPLPQNFSHCSLFVLFFWNIYGFSSSSFREYSQMCKATSNSNISWSKKWNLHLTASFNNVQSPFNRKMEQSANRKRKGLIKTHPAPSWRSPPTTETRHRLSWEEQELCIDPQHWQTQTELRRAKGGFFIEDGAGGCHNTSIF